MTDQDRHAFEAWVSDAPYEKSTARYNNPLDPWPGQYKRVDVELAWQAWLAALAHRDAQLAEADLAALREQLEAAEKRNKELQELADNAESWATEATSLRQQLNNAGSAIQEYQARIAELERELHNANESLPPGGLTRNAYEKRIAELEAVVPLDASGHPIVLGQRYLCPVDGGVAELLALTYTLGADKEVWIGMAQNPQSNMHYRPPRLLAALAARREEQR